MTNLTQRIANSAPCIVALTTLAAFLVAVSHIGDVSPSALWQGCLLVARLIARG